MRPKTLTTLEALATPRPAISRWIIAFVLFGAGLLVRLLFSSWLEPNKFLTFYPAVAATALLCGWVEGAAVAILSAVSAWFFFFNPPFSPAIRETNAIRLLVGFLSVDAFLIWVVWSLRRTVCELSKEISARAVAEAELRENNRRKDEFLGTLAHELRNPLAPIHNLTHVLKKKHGQEPSDASLLDIVERQVTHLIRLTDDLLDITRLNLNKVELRKEEIDVLAVVREAMETCQPYFDKKDHRVTCSFPSQPIWIHADSLRVGQVAINLLANAAKFTPPHGLLDITVAQEGDMAVLRVRDNGIGLPADMLARVFDVFAQVEREDGKSHSGLGIGLALSRKLVELHGGSIEALSAGLGLGCEFMVRLPLAENK